MLYFVEDAFERLHFPAWAKGALGFAGVGLIGIWYPQIFGVGYESIQQVLSEHVRAGHALLLAALKPVATSLTLGSGGSGGVFAPCLFTGAFLGDAFGRVAHGLFPLWTAPPAAYGLVAMAAVFAAAAEAPITAIMIVFEMSSDYTIILPLMVTVVIASLLGRRFLGSTIYERKLLRRGVDWQKARHPRFFTRLAVSSVGRLPPLVAQVSQSIASVASSTEGDRELVVPVCDGERFVGTATTADLARAVASGAGNQSVASILREGRERLSPNDTLERAANLMADVDTPLLPVISEDDGHLLAIVTRRDLLNAYRSSSET